MTCAALGFPFWSTINVILVSLLVGQRQQWTAEGMRALFPALIGWFLFCFFLGILSQAAREVAKYFLGPESPAPRALPSGKNDPSGYSRRWLRRGLDCGDSPKPRPGRFRSFFNPH